MRNNGVSMKTKVTGRQKQLIKQVGEYLVAAELCRRELIATSFSGNVPIFDILAITSDEKMKTIQVKATITNGGWNLDAIDYLDFQPPTDDSQYIKGILKLPNNNTIFCFVKLGSFGKEKTSSAPDEFYLLPIDELQKIIEKRYSAFLTKVKHIRPKKHDSHHAKIKKHDISSFKDNWDCLLR
jgi:hypothetical protein